MDELDRIRAALPEFGYADYLQNLDSAEKASADARPLHIVVLRSYTAEAIEPVLRLRLCLNGFRPELRFGGYNAFVQELLDPSSIAYSGETDVALILLRIEEFLPDLIEAFDGRSVEAWEQRIDEAVAGFADLVRTFRSRSTAHVLVQNFLLADRGYWGIYDSQTPDGQGYLVAELNRRLARALESVPGAYVWDFCRLAQRLGYERIFDRKMWYLAKSPYRQTMLPALAEDLERHMLSMVGRLNKCVVLDLDNTLWGGVVGEDGIEGIRLGHTYPGVCYREFQKELLKLNRRGVILAINSKNNEADALEVIDKHPDMVLRREHFSAMRINWQDKASNIRALAEMLNIGIDSMIMVDDNPVECEQIAQQLPECTTVCLPAQPYRIPEIVASLPGLDNIRLTEEDKKKGAMYQAQIERQKFQDGFADLSDFLTSLELEISIDEANSYSIPRISQLTQKTNQMNVTTRRYSEAEIAEMARDPDSFVYAVSAKDKFGDHGIVGVMILRKGDRNLRIDTLLLSCRVIGRNLEDAMVAHAADQARAIGLNTLIGEFLPTPKNAPAAGLFERLGFERLDETLFEADVRAGGLAAPDYVRVVAG